MKFLKSSTALIAAISMAPAMAYANNYGSDYTAHERCKQGEDNRQVLGGLAGAVVGGVFGSQVSGRGARTEGSAIGAVLGGLAGAGIADKSIDCDPVYETRDSGYSAQPTSQYGTTQYGTTQYGSGQQYGTTQYGSTSYGSGGYGATSTQTSSQPYYEDRVTVSNHPVYSDPYYGAGGISQGSTYSTGNVTYPPSGNNSQYGARVYAPTEVVRSYSAPAPVTTYAQAPVRTYTQAQPVTQRVVYSAPSQPRYIQADRHRTITSSRTHYHGRYSCDMNH